MAEFLTPETFEFFARYLLAGYVVIIVRSRFILGVRAKTSDLVIEAVIFSLLIQLAVIFLRVPAIWVVDYFSGSNQSANISTNLALFLEVLVLPSLIGLILGWNSYFGWNNTILRRLSMPIVHPVQRAHDFAFGNARDPCLVILTFEDDTVIRGFFGETSLAASDASRSDIYLERLYIEDKTGQWSEPSPGRSGLVSLTGIRSIEFLDVEENDNGEI
jgi:hypothetical protein